MRKVGVVLFCLFSCFAGSKESQSLPTTTDQLQSPITVEVGNGFSLPTASIYGVVPADYDGDGKADLALKTDGGRWLIDFAKNGFSAWDMQLQLSGGYGGIEALPVPADYDGDGKADLAIKTDGGAWLIDYAKNGFGAWDPPQLNGGYGGPEALPVPADYDGDGKVDLAIKEVMANRDAAGNIISEIGWWRIDYAKNGFGTWDAQWPGYGGTDAIPVPADYDGDGKVDFAVKTDGGAWLIDYARTGFGSWDLQFPKGYGGANAHPVPADYDGDRKADLAVKDDGGTWYIDYAANGFGAWNAVIPGAGGTTARAVPADYDGDRKADLAVRVDCGAWIIDYASDGFGVWNQRFGYMITNSVITVTNPDVLIDTLQSDFTGTIFIPSDAEITLADRRFVPVKSCVQIKGTRNGVDPGALLHTEDQTKGPVFVVSGHDVHLEGLRFRGPLPTGNRDKSQPVVGAIAIIADPSRGHAGNVIIDNNNIWFWTQAIGINNTATNSPMTKDQASLITVTRNYIHRNARDGWGYGVVITGGYVQIEGNLFDHNRHAIASHGTAHSGYIARNNYVLEGGFTEGAGFWNQHFDVHGTANDGYGGVAGEYVEIAFNTVRGEQQYGVLPSLSTRPVFMLRGKPTIGASFHHNVVVHDDTEKAVRLKTTYYYLDQSGEQQFKTECDSPTQCNLSIGQNTYDIETTGDLAVGDFDGDGRDDVFLANGTGWWYSSAGLTEWRFLRPSNLRIKDLRFGRFDADSRTDVLFPAGDWYIWSVGQIAPQHVRVNDAHFVDCVFGDFNGDGITDALRANGSSWSVAYGARGPWIPVHSSSVTAVNLRAGDFNGDHRDEVFTWATGTWTLWDPVNNQETRDQRKPMGTIDMASLVVADFDGDGLVDVGQTDGSGWRWIRGGTNIWAPFRTSGGQNQYKGITEVLFGRFTQGDRQLDALRYEQVKQIFNDVDQYLPGPRFVIWSGVQDAFQWWTPVGQEMR